MALPPEPLGELIPKSSAIVVAVVVAVLALGPKPPPPPNARKLPKGATSVGYQSASQKVRLKVERCLLGKVPEEIEVEKPVAPYILRVGDKGPFFLDKDNRILGRYGPDTHSLASIERALAAKPGAPSR